MTSTSFLIGDSITVLRTLPAASVDLVLTSPPFLALRSYLPADHPEKHHEIGSEATPAEFLDVLLDCTEEWARVLTPHGSIAVELGDTYAGTATAGQRYDEWPGKANGYPRHEADKAGPGWPLDKSLTCIPALYEASLAYGRNLLNGRLTDPWRVRNLIAWVRPNPPVGALGDKVRPATSYLTWACKARDRWFDLDAVRQAASPSTHGRSSAPRHDLPSQQRDGNWSTLAQVDSDPDTGAPPLDWWKIVPGGFSGAHYAVFPEELCVIPIQASCPRRVCVTCGSPSRRITDTAYVSHRDGRVVEPRPWASGDLETGKAQAATGIDKGMIASNTTVGWTSCGCPGTDRLRLDGYHNGAGWRPGLVLDPFVGSGTTLAVAHGHGRDAIGIDIDSRNAELARERLGLFVEIRS